MSLLTNTAVNKMVLKYEINMNKTMLINSLDQKSFEDEIADYRLTVACSLALLVGVIQVRTK